jgi:CHAD domain-containing protein
MAGLKSTLEHELKLGAPGEFRLPDFPGEPLPERILTSTYFDTDDLRLARHGVTLRRRVEAGTSVWHLKLPRGASRTELELAGGKSKPPAELLDLVTAFAAGRELNPVITLRTRRTGTRVFGPDASAVAEVTLDAVSVIRAGHVVHGFREIEAEALEGERKHLPRIERVLRAAGAADGDPRPKPLQALGLPAPDALRRPARDAPLGEQLRFLLGAQYRAILAHDPGTRLGDDPEELHQMRVATRRLRALLRAAAPVLDPEAAARLRAEAGWLGTALGPVRDLDVLLGHLYAEAESFEPAEQQGLRHLFEVFEEERTARRASMLEKLRSPRYFDVLSLVEAAAEEPPVVFPDGSVGELAAAEFRRLRKAVDGLPSEPADDVLHDIRIRAKRARYAAELAEIAIGKRATRFIEAAKALQDVLGEHQDATVAEERIRAALARKRSAALAFACGRLVERERERKRAARAAFPHAWARLEARGRTAWT